MDVGRAGIEDADRREHRVCRAALRPGGVSFLAADIKFHIGGRRARGGGIDVGQDRVALRRARPAELLEDAGVARLACAVVTVDDRQPDFPE